MPSLAQCMYHSLLDRTSTRSTYWYAHLIMTSQTIQIAILFTSISCQFDTVYRKVIIINSCTHSSQNSLKLISIPFWLSKS